jgi:thiol-disulfide isomerase/thioredoxin
VTRKQLQMGVLIAAVAALALGAVYAMTTWLVQDETLRGGRIVGGIENFRSVAPRPAPDTPFVDAAGAQRTLADFRGRWVLVNLWATWCAPCLEEMPALDRLQAKLGGPEFEVVAISLDREGREVAERYRRELGLQHLAFYQDSTMRMTGAFRAPGLPATMLIDPEGREIARLLGPAEWDGDEAVAKLAALRRR